MLKLSLSTSLALATVATLFVAAPSFAATRHVRAVTVDASDAYAAAPGYGYASSPIVIVNGQVVGADPDPTIRLQLMKDAATPNE
jgi:hypothetical protein